MTTTSHALIASAAVAAALALAGCEAQPVGSFDQARYAADSGQAQTDLLFQPGSPALARGESERVTAFLRALALGPQEDVVLHMGRSGQPTLDARRLTTLRSTFRSTPARVRLVLAPGFTNSDTRPDTVLVQVIRYDRIRVECPGNTAGPYELTTPLPSIGCANATNRATMAAEVRDLVAPRRFGGSDAVPSAAAVQRQREGKVITAPLGSSTGN